MKTPSLIGICKCSFSLVIKETFSQLTIKLNFPSLLGELYHVVEDVVFAVS